MSNKSPQIPDNLAMQCIQTYAAKASSGVVEVTKPSTSKAVIKSLRDSASYAIGSNVGTAFKFQSLTDLKIDLLKKGLNDKILGRKLGLNESQAQQCVASYMQILSAKKSEPLKAAGKKFMDENAKKPGVKTMAEGWQYEVLKESTSLEKPKPTDKVKVHYHGTLVDGTVFDSSVDRGEPIVFGLNQVIRGWTLAVSQMPVGSKWKIVLPSDLAYGDRGAGEKIGPGATLIFEVELLGIEK